MEQCKVLGKKLCSGTPRNHIRDDLNLGKLFCNRSNIFPADFKRTGPIVIGLHQQCCISPYMHGVLCAFHGFPGIVTPCPCNGLALTLALFHHYPDYLVVLFPRQRWALSCRSYSEHPIHTTCNLKFHQSSQTLQIYLMVLEGRHQGCITTA